ncbi:MAG: hypothetical protein K6F33_01735 [Bacteroidales bacterium]|nr:hypothetical protein [Bacteroidales bacterium]
MKYLSKVLVLAALAAVGCQGNVNTNNQQPAEQQAVEQKPAPEPATYLTAIEDYLVKQIGSQYSQGKVCFPSYTVLSVDEQNPDDILVLGDFYVYNYDVSGDTLKSVSGGNHPGNFHVSKKGNDFTVTNFEQVADGSNFMPTAKKIFGDKIDAFQKLHSDQDARQKCRTEFINKYAKKQNLKVTLLEDFNGDIIKLQ